MTEELFLQIIEKFNLNYYHEHNNYINFKPVNKNMYNKAIKYRIFKSEHYRRHGSEYFIYAMPKDNGTYDIFYVRKSDHFGEFTPRNESTKIWLLNDHEYWLKKRRKLGYVFIANVNIDILVKYYTCYYPDVLTPILINKIDKSYENLVNEPHGFHIYDRYKVYNFYAQIFKGEKLDNKNHVVQLLKPYKRKYKNKINELKRLIKELQNKCGLNYFKL